MFIYNRKAYYHETDQMGVIHHSNYIKWMEEARIEFMEAIGLGYDKVEAMGIVSPVTNISIDYKSPVKFTDEVEIRVSIAKYNGTVLEIAYEFFDVTTGKVSNRAHSKHCFTKGGRIISLKKEIPELDTALLENMDGAEA